MANMAMVCNRWRGSLLILGASLLLMLGGCASSSSKPAAEPTGSLVRTFTLMDEQGHKSGTLVINPLGGAELRDLNGKLIGTLSGNVMTQPDSPSSPAPQSEGVK